MNDMNALNFLYYEPGGYYILDRGYIDYARLFRINQSSTFFVIRAKDNLQFRRIYSDKVNKNNGVLFDQIGKLTGFYVSQRYPDKLRRIKFYDEEMDNELMFLSNNFDLMSEEIVVELSEDWPDFVFKKDYQLMALSDLEDFIMLNNHLPKLPSAEVIKKEGIDIGEMNILLLEKIEELTLYYTTPKRKYLLE